MIIVKRGLVSKVRGGHREISRSAVGGGVARLLDLTVLIEVPFSSNDRMRRVGGDHRSRQTWISRQPPHPDCVMKGR